jgi:hypothetical protein
MSFEDRNGDPVARGGVKGLRKIRFAPKLFTLEA